MIKYLFIFYLLLFSHSFYSQVVVKPKGTFVGTNGTNVAALNHVEARGVLLIESWQNIETSPGVFNFSGLDSKISIAKSNNKKYALGIGIGAFGSPSWLIDSLGASYFEFSYQGNTERLPLWWDSIVTNRYNMLVEAVGQRYNGDSSLSHVYVSQMSTNGMEGHLNGVNMTDFRNAGFEDSLWVNSAVNGTIEFAKHFEEVPIVFEVHEIDSDTSIVFDIFEKLKNESTLCKRLGLALWWISGKETYQTDLLEFIRNYEGDIYAQVIGRSDQEYRFKDSSYSTVFVQAKDLNVRYIEPWPYEFQNNTNDSLFHDFNMWADSMFSNYDSCSTFVSHIDEIKKDKWSVNIYPNPFIHSIHVNTEIECKLSIYSYSGQLKYTQFLSGGMNHISLSHLSKGVYMIVMQSKDDTMNMKLIKD